MHFGRRWRSAILAAHDGVELFWFSRRWLLERTAFARRVWGGPKLVLYVAFAGLAAPGAGPQHERAGAALVLWPSYWVHGCDGQRRSFAVQSGPLMPMRRRVHMPATSSSSSHTQKGSVKVENAARDTTRSTQDNRTTNKTIETPVPNAAF